METFKCDRCGKYFDTYGGLVSRGKISFATFSKAEAYVIFRDAKNTPLDLCSECVQDFKNWFNDGRNPKIKYSDKNITTFDPNKRIDISEGLDPKTGEWGHNS